ncbi:MAG: glycosyltransferase family 9 protein [Elusimicrobiota bacterium]|jgi:lipopolysaccharide heptosyltransferase II
MDKRRKILIIQLKRAGDVLVTTPVLPVLRQQFPEARIDFLTEGAFAPLLEQHPDVDQVQVYDPRAVLSSIRKVRRQRYDWIIDFQSSPRSALLVFLSGARLTVGYRVPFWGRVYRETVKRPVGRQSVVDGKFSLVENLTGPVAERPMLKIYLSDDEKKWAAGAMESVSAQAIVGLVPTHRRVSRRWPVESYAALAQDLIRRENDVWLFWGPGEEPYVDRLSRMVPGARKIPPTTLRQMAALLERCRLVITNDSGPMHLAVAAGAQTLTLYGPTDPVNWNPGVPPHRFLQADGVPCLGCNLNECPFQHECMTRLASEMVFKNAMEIVNPRGFR